MNTYKAKKMARALMDENGLTDWEVDIQQGSHGWAGDHWSGVTEVDNLTILFRWQWVKEHDEETVKDCILHEMAHALCEDASHGLVWRTKALELGCSLANASRYDWSLEKEQEVAARLEEEPGYSFNREDDGLYDLSHPGGTITALTLMDVEHALDTNIDAFVDGIGGGGGGDEYGRRPGVCNECGDGQDWDEEDEAEVVLVVCGVCQWCDEGEWRGVPWPDRTDEDVDGWVAEFAGVAS